MKPRKFAIAIVLPNSQDAKEVLAVLRPPTDESLPNVWGLPAVLVKEGELPEDAVRRIGKEKLATDIEPVSFVGIKSHNRGNYELILMDVKARVVSKEPNVQEAVTTGTKYVEQKWTSDYSIFIPGAQKGSVCDRIFLESLNINWE